MHAWESSIDARLVARLVRPVVSPGVIRMALAHRILAGVAALAARLPLLRRFGGRRDLVVNTPIIHARWTNVAPPEPTTPHLAPVPIVHATPVRTIERVVERAPEAMVMREPAATTTLECAVVAEPSRLTSTSPATLVAPIYADERVVDRPFEAVVTREPATTASLGRATIAEMSPPTSALSAIASPRIGHATSGAASKATHSEDSHVRALDRGNGADATTRRSRVGAPLPARLQIASSPARDVPGTPRASIVPFAPVAGTSPCEAPDGSIASPAGAACDGTATLIASLPRCVRPRAAVGNLLTSSASTSDAPRVIAARATRKAPVIASLDRSTPVIVSVARPERMLVDRRSASVVRPARTSEGDRARATDLPLARPLASAVPGTSAVPPIEPSPIPTPTPPSIVDTAAPPAPAPLKIDLHRLADQVQRILLRQAEHGRARQGLPR